MSGKRKRTPELVHIICTRPYHEGTREWARRKYHRIVTLQRIMVEKAPGEYHPVLILPGQQIPDYTWSLPDPDALFKETTQPDNRQLPVKNWYRAGSNQWDTGTFRLRCTCSRADIQRSGHELLDRLQERFALGETRVLLDIWSL